MKVFDKVFDEKLFIKAGDPIPQDNAPWYFRQIRHCSVGADMDHLGTEDLVEIWIPRDRIGSSELTIALFTGDDGEFPVTELVRFSDDSVLVCYDAGGVTKFDYYKHEIDLLSDLSAYKVTKEKLSWGDKL